MFKRFCFEEIMDDLFDIAHSDIQIKNEDNEAFLLFQRQKGRPGSMAGVNKILKQ